MKVTGFVFFFVSCLHLFFYITHLLCCPASVIFDLVFISGRGRICLDAVGLWLLRGTFFLIFFSFQERTQVKGLKTPSASLGLKQTRT